MKCPCNHSKIDYISRLVKNWWWTHKWCRGRLMGQYEYIVRSPRLSIWGESMHWHEASICWMSLPVCKEKSVKVHLTANKMSCREYSIEEETIDQWNWCWWPWCWWLIQGNRQWAKNDEKHLKVITEQMNSYSFKAFYFTMKAMRQCAGGFWNVVRSKGGLTLFS